MTFIASSLSRLTLGLSTYLIQGSMTNLSLTMPQEHSRSSCKCNCIYIPISSQQAKVINNSQGKRLKVPNLCLVFLYHVQRKMCFCELRLSFSYTEVFLRDKS
jgi:hypothetical protein